MATSGEAVTLGGERGLDGGSMALFPGLEGHHRVRRHPGLYLGEHVDRLGSRHDDDALFVRDHHVARIDDNPATANGRVHIAAAAALGGNWRGAAGEDGEEV